MARRGGDLEAFIAFCLGGTAAFLSWLGLHCLAEAEALPPPIQGHTALTVALIGLTCTVLAYRTLRTPIQIGDQLAALRLLKETQRAKASHSGAALQGARGTAHPGARGTARNRKKPT
ncbi:hypothetical protein CFP65_4408 [Kitasatospora sp. MMS16-BH015]|uniref:hypothetical protein n=1 Tax=Kitasatospora sp. MMS16-BH015 TaxID=2018025 RepID=UPI000CA1880B|nr:hypothetical protein [Kitasatospora sp. MMS16-BH015]AUG79157.1 hypothetical protein CFP65_4408 [Kitasatospora sp. MMS16-BH015]